ncbi:MAG: hypothetical protein OXU62_11090 [Gammaproteobacteria bacterium]|nr:hypothetical protein [Gammaproteobacteria bacterium]
MTAAAMDDDAFRAFRKIGLPEEIAAKVARVIRRDRGDDEFVTKADRETEREAAARAVREAERAADREAFAARDDVTVLQTEMTDVKTAIVRIDKSIERIDATIVGIKETAARTDEKINSLQAQNKIFIIPLLFLTVGALVGLLTKGVLWGVAP